MGHALTDTVERLFAEFEGRIPLPTVVATVRRAKHDIDITDGPALPELVERLARQRLVRLAADHGAGEMGPPAQSTVR